jgi:hypothetical protein
MRVRRSASRGIARAAILLALAATGCGQRSALPPEPEAGSSPTPPDVPAPPDVPGPDASSPEAAGPDAPSGPRVPYRAIGIAVGRVHVCVILDDHGVKCWGDNSEGQLGLGDSRPRGADPSEMGDALPTVDLGTGRTARAIVARSYSTCALLDDGSVKCWGQPKANPSAATGAHGGIGDDPDEMGDHLPPVDLGANRKASAIALGELEVCAACDDGALVCWEYAVAQAQPPTVITRRPSAAVVHMAGADSVLGLFADNSIWSLPVNPAQQRHQFSLAPGERAQNLFALQINSCALLDTGGLKCWPTRTLGDPATQTPPTPETDLSALAFTEFGSSCWLRTKGVVECRHDLGPWGTPIDSDTARVKLPRPAVAIDGGGQTMTCAILDDASVRCWGAATTAPWQGSSTYSDAGWPPVNLGTRPAP